MRTASAASAASPPAASGGSGSWRSRSGVSADGEREVVVELGVSSRIDCAGRRLAGRPQLGEPRGKLAGMRDREPERTAGRSQAAVDAEEHRAQAARAVRREQAQALGLASGAKRRQRIRERLGGEHRGLALVEHTEAGVDPGLERVHAQHARAEAVDRRDPGAVDVAGQITPAGGAQPLPNALPQLAGGPLRVGDHEDRVEREPPLEHRQHDPLDEHGRLPCAGARRDEDDAGLRDGGRLLGVDHRRAHARRTLQIGHAPHQAGHSPKRGLWRTSPSRISPAASRASATAASTRPQKVSSSR